MKRIAFTCACFLITIFLFSLNGYSAIPVHQNSTKDTLENAVIFTVDEPVLVNGVMKPINLYTLDSLGWGKGFGILLKNQKSVIYSPLLLLEPNATQTPHLIYPHEKINVRYAGTDSIRMYIPGNNTRTNELNFFRKLVQKTGNIYYFFSPMPYQRKVNSLNAIHLLEKTIDSVKNNRLRFLSSYGKQFQISDSFVKIAINCISSTSIDDSLLLYQNNKDLLKSLNLYTPYAMAKIASVNNIGFAPYPMFLQVGKHVVAMATGTNPNDITDVKSNVFRRRFDFISKNFTGDTKNYLLANTMNIVHRNKVPISKTDLAKFDKECTSAGYRALIHIKLRDDATAIKVPKGANRLLALDGKNQDLSAVILNNKGKLILLDFWASWCGPCRAEMPYNARLKEKYKGKNIVFVTLSTDSHISDWKKAAKEEAMKNENNFLLIDTEASILKSYQINSIPRYILLGKDGKALNDDAPRPSDEALKVIIDKYL